MSLLDRLLGPASETLETLYDPPYLREREERKVVSEHAGKNTFPPTSSPSSPSSPRLYAPPFPDAVPGLGPRRVVAFAPCADCEGTDREPETVRLRGPHGVVVSVPVEPRVGTFTTYGDVPLCAVHARAREEARC